MRGLRALIGIDQHGGHPGFPRAVDVKPEHPERQLPLDTAHSDTVAICASIGPIGRGLSATSIRSAITAES